MVNSLKEMLDEQYSKEKEIKNFKLSVEEYLNKEDIYKIIKDSIKNNFRFMRYYGDFQINFTPTQFGMFSGVTILTRLKFKQLEQLMKLQVI